MANPWEDARNRRAQDGAATSRNSPFGRQPLNGDAPQTDEVAAPGGNDDLTHHPVHFAGTGSEFFGIWIVNIVLTIVTLGIYSAWAKVRTKRYFNGNTFIDGQPFDYHAEPIQILKGRILVVVVLIVLGIVSNLSPELAGIITIFYMIALPWIIVRGLAFNANMTSYRNVRFGFSGRKRSAFMAYIVWPFLAILTAFILLPFASRANARFLGNGHRFGTARFSANPETGGFYKGLFAALAALVAAGIIALAIGFALATAETDGGPGDGLAAISGLAIVLLIYLAIGLAYTAYSVVARNHSFTSLELHGGHRFSSDMKVLPYTWIVMSNLVLIVCTIGLFIPFAQVRVAKYKAAHTHVFAHGDLDRFTQGVVSEEGVASGEFLDIEGMDFGF